MKIKNKKTATKETVLFFERHIIGVTQKIGLDKTLADLFISKWECRVAKARKILSDRSQPFDEIWFVANGGLRALHIVNQKESTHLIVVEGQFTSDYKSFLENTTATLSFETLVDSVVFSIKREVFNLFCVEYPMAFALKTYFSQYMYLAGFHLILDFQTKKLKDRYKDLIENVPRIIEYAQQQDIAAYLGVKPESLSRVRAELAKELMKNK